MIVGAEVWCCLCYGPVYRPLSLCLSWANGWPQGEADFSPHQLRARKLWKLWEWEMDVITGSTNSSKLTLSGSLTPPSPLPSPCFRLWLSTSTFFPSAVSVHQARTTCHSRTSEAHTHLKTLSFPALPLSYADLEAAGHPSSPSCSPTICKSIDLSICRASQTHHAQIVCLEGVQVFRHSLQPRLLDHYYSIISSNGGRAADA